MRENPGRRKPDPRSPVQPGRNPAPYFLAAIVAAVAIWVIQQNMLQDFPDVSDRTAVDRERPRRADARGDLRSVFSSDDYPVIAQQNGEEGSVRAELIVDDHGRVSRCSILSSSGHRSLDHATCQILQRRARFTPARDVNGRPMPDRIVTPSIVWRLEG
jgi:TonB family protein